MTARSQRALIFGIALAIGMAAIDWASGQSINVLKILVGGLVGGCVYWWILKWQGR